MNGNDDASFLTYWAENREKELTSKRPFLVGLSSGFAVGILIILVLQSGWYQRANMVANAGLSSFILLICILIISVFIAFIYRKFRWEMLEQRYLELLAAKKKREKSHIKEEAKQP